MAIMILGIPVKAPQFPLQLGSLLSTAGIGTVPLRFEDGRLSWSSTREAPLPLTHLVLTHGLPGSPNSEFSYHSTARPATGSQNFIAERGLYTSAMKYGMQIAADRSRSAHDRSSKAIRIAGNGTGKADKESSLQNAMELAKAAFAISSNEDITSKMAMAGYLFSAAMMFMENGFPIAAAISSEISADLFRTPELRMGFGFAGTSSEGAMRSRQLAASAWRVAAMIEGESEASNFFIARGIVDAWHDSGHEEMEALLKISSEFKLSGGDMAGAGEDLLRSAYFLTHRARQKPWDRIGNDIQMGTSYLMARGNLSLNIGLARDLMFSAKQLS